MYEIKATDVIQLRLISEIMCSLHAQVISHIFSGSSAIRFVSIDGKIQLILSCVKGIQIDLIFDGSQLLHTSV
jgi:hypothetical protein